MNRNKLKQYIKEVIRKELNEQPSFKLPVKKPTLKLNPDFDAKSKAIKDPNEKPIK